MSWMESVDAYCERVGPEFWSEPVNAITNAAFLIAAVAAARIARRQAPGDRPVVVLVAILALIGIGSFLFHTFATRWAAVADVVPIITFIYLYFFFAMRRFLGLDLWWALAVTLGFFGASVILAPAASQIVGSSGAYVPAALAIFAVAILSRRSRDDLAVPLAIAGLVFVISLGFRTGDILFCPSFPLGTHFVWHCLNAVVLYLLIRVMVRARASSAEQ